MTRDVQTGPGKELKWSEIVNCSVAQTVFADVDDKDVTIMQGINTTIK